MAHSVSESKRYGDDYPTWQHERPTISKGTYTFPCKGKVVLAERYGTLSKSWRGIGKDIYYRNNIALTVGNQDDYSASGQFLHLYYWNFDVGDVLTAKKNDLAFYSVILDSPQGSTDKLISEVVSV